VLWAGAAWCSDFGQSAWFHWRSYYESGTRGPICVSVLTVISFTLQQYSHVYVWLRSINPVLYLNRGLARPGCHAGGARVQPRKEGVRDAAPRIYFAGSNLDPANLMLFCLGHSSPIVLWDCISSTQLQQLKWARQKSESGSTPTSTMSPSQQPQPWQKDPISGAMSAASLQAILNFQIVQHRSV